MEKDYNREIIELKNEIKRLNKELDDTNHGILALQNEFLADKNSELKKKNLELISIINEKEKLEKSKKEIISVVSHELRAPLTSILGSLNIILSKMRDKSINDALDLLDISYKTGVRMKNLINNLLDIDKIESGKIELNFQENDLSELIEISINELKPQLSEKIIKIDNACGVHNVYCDYNSTIRIFNNLLSNAVKFSENNSSIKIFTDNENEKYITIAVKDYGRGLPDNFKDKVFLKFRQAESEDASVKGGSGLGLAITKMLVEIQGGIIWFESEYGHGASFFFTLRR